MMLIYIKQGYTLVGTFDFSEELWTGTAAKKLWNQYQMISRQSKKEAENFISIMMSGGQSNGYFSVQQYQSKKMVD